MEIFNSYHDLILIELIQSYNFDWNIIEMKYKEKFEKDLEYCQKRFEYLKETYSKDINEIIDILRREEINRLDNLLNQLKLLSKLDFDPQILDQFLLSQKPTKKTITKKLTPIITKDQMKREREETSPSQKKKKKKEYSLLDIVKEIKEKDTNNIFLNPVSLDDAPEYDTIIKKRMDLSTIENLIESNKINSKEELLKNLLLMYMNAQIFNNPTSFVYNQTLELRNFTKKLFQ